MLCAAQNSISMAGCAQMAECSVRSQANTRVPGSTWVQANQRVVREDFVEEVALSR